jgi:hypothetical protein
MTKLLSLYISILCIAVMTVPATTKNVNDKSLRGEEVLIARRMLSLKIMSKKGYPANFEKMQSLINAGCRWMRMR